MKVKALVNCSGIKFSMSVGEVKDLDDFIAKDLLRAGYVEETTPAPRVKEEKAEAKAEPKKTEAKKRTTKK